MAQLGGKVEARPPRRVRPRLRHPDRDADDPLFTGLFHTGREEVWMSHGDRVTALAPGFAVIGTSPERPLRHHRRPGAPLLRPSSSTPRSHHTVNGARHPAELHRPRRLHRRLDDGRLQGPGDRRASAPRSATPGSSAASPAASTRSVAAVLIHEAIGDQLTCVFVDTGLMRQGEAERGRHPLPRPLQHPADPRRRGRPLPRRARRRHRPRGEAQDHRPPVHRGLRGARAERSATPTSSPRARSTPT